MGLQAIPAQFLEILRTLATFLSVVLVDSHL